MSYKKQFKERSIYFGVPLEDMHPSWPGRHYSRGRMFPSWGQRLINTAAQLEFSFHSRSPAHGVV